ncbi:ribonuclease H-like domain-containing protein [Tanacetum coccineum]
MVTRAKGGIFKPLERMNYHVTTTSPLPRSHVHALCDPNWKEAMLDEYNALITNGTYKARLVANGCSQQQGIDCDKTFSPVVRPATIHMVLSLSVSRNWPIHQLDVKNVFLHGQLFETVYMHQPPGFVDSSKLDYVCHLQKSLYGLKQAHRAWFQRFASFATRIGFHHSKTDASLFVYHPQRTTSGLFLSQSKFAEEILEKAHMKQCNPCRTPVDAESKNRPEGAPVVDPTLYRSLAGAL